MRILVFQGTFRAVNLHSAIGIGFQENPNLTTDNTDKHRFTRIKKSSMAPSLAASCGFNKSGGFQPVQSVHLSR
jgi:hypothetical protein